MKNYKKLAISIGGCYLAAFLGSVVTFPSINGWYANLIKPSFNPPNWIFGPVWTILYLLMGISFYLIWQKNIKGKTTIAIRVFIIQLVLNFLWSFIFFGLHQPFLAYIEIFLLWMAIFLTILKFWHFSKAASYLLIPYLLWVSFASILNLAIVALNK